MHISVIVTLFVVILIESYATKERYKCNCVENECHCNLDEILSPTSTRTPVVQTISSYVGRSQLFSDFTNKSDLNIAYLLGYLTNVLNYVKLKLSRFQIA